MKKTSFLAFFFHLAFNWYYCYCTRYRTSTVLVPGIKNGSHQINPLTLNIFKVIVCAPFLQSESK